MGRTAISISEATGKHDLAELGQRYPGLSPALLQLIPSATEEPADLHAALEPHEDTFEDLSAILSDGELPPETQRIFYGPRALRVLSRLTSSPRQRRLTEIMHTPIGSDSPLSLNNIADMPGQLDNELILALDRVFQRGEERDVSQIAKLTLWAIAYEVYVLKRNSGVQSRSPTLIDRLGRVFESYFSVRVHTAAARIFGELMSPDEAAIANSLPDLPDELHSYAGPLLIAKFGLTYGILPEGIRHLIEEGYFAFSQENVGLFLRHYTMLYTARHGIDILRYHSLIDRRRSQKAIKELSEHAFFVDDEDEDSRVVLQRHFEDVLLAVQVPHHKPFLISTGDTLFPRIRVTSNPAGKWIHVELMGLDNQVVGYLAIGSGGRMIGMGRRILDNNPSFIQFVCQQIRRQSEMDGVIPRETGGESEDIPEEPKRRVLEGSGLSRGEWKKVQAARQQEFEEAEEAALMIDEADTAPVGVFVFDRDELNAVIPRKYAGLVTMIEDALAADERENFPGKPLVYYYGKFGLRTHRAPMDMRILTYFDTATGKWKIFRVGHRGDIYKGLRRK